MKYYSSEEDTTDASAILSEADFEQRNVTWKTLTRDHLHLIWHPQFVDCALNYVPGANSAAAIVASTRFLEGCREYAGLSDNGLDSDLCTPSDLLRPDGGQQSHLNVFLKEQVAKTLLSLRATDNSASGREEVANALRYQFILNAANYRPGSRLADGTYKTFGYSAFQRSYLRAAWRPIKRGFSSAVELQENDQTAVDSPTFQRVEATPDFRLTLVDALRLALPDLLGWRVFVGLIFDDRLLEDLARELDATPSFISIAVTPSIVAIIQASFGDGRCTSFERIKITDLRDSLTQILSKEDFVRLVPPPIMSCPGPRRRSSTVSRRESPQPRGAPSHATRPLRNESGKVL